MRLRDPRVLALVLLAPLGADSSARSSPVTPSPAAAVHRHARLAFEPNRGQFPASASYGGEVHGYEVRLGPSGATLVLSHPSDVVARGATAPRAEAEVLRLSFTGAVHELRIAGEDPLAGRAHYFLGNDPARWQRDVPTYGRVRYTGVYPGIDAVFYGTSEHVEYDFVVAPGAAVDRIGLEIQGSSSIALRRGGDLTVKAGSAVVTFRQPVAYQLVSGERRLVACRYVVDGQRLRFETGEYDKRHTLVIDPVIVYSSYFGEGVGSGTSGIGHTGAKAIATDPAGNIYIAGLKSQNIFSGAVQYGPDPSDAMFVAKFAPDGGTLLYKAVIGGSGNDGADDMAVDAAGDVYLVGRVDANSTDFPVSPGAFQPIYGGGVHDAVVCKLSSDGAALLYASFLGGPGVESGESIAVDTAGFAYVMGGADVGFPTAGTPFQSAILGNSELYVAKINTTGTALVYSTFLGSSGFDHAGGDIAVDAAGSVYVTGGSNGVDFPTTPGAFDTTPDAPGHDGPFVTKLSPDGSTLEYSTWLGSLGFGNGIAVDALGQAYVVGATEATNFPVVGMPAQPVKAAGTTYDAFVARFSADGSSVIAATYFGGSVEDVATDVAVDSSGQIVVSGETFSDDLPVLLAFQPARAGSVDAFVAKFNPTAGLIFASYFGGTGVESGEQINPSPACCSWTSLALDPDDHVLLTGRTSSTDLVTTADAHKHQLEGYTATYVVRIADVVEVPIDIKPGSFPNSINLGSNGTVAVAILSTATFDATTVDPLTVTLASAPVRLKGKGTPMASTSDVNQDGRLDLIVHVSTDALQLSNEDTTADLEGETFGGLLIRGSDSVRIVY